MWKFLEIARAGAHGLLLYPLRTLATLGCLLAALGPYLVGSGIAKGIEAEAVISIHQGADLYVSGMQLGQRAPLPRTAQQTLEQIEGVTKVVPRIVGTIYLGRHQEAAVLLGLPGENFPQAADCVTGRLPRDSALHEFVMGSDLARRLELVVGSRIPPFYRNHQGEKNTEIVGLFRSDASFWQAKLILTTFATAEYIFDQPGLATDFLVYCRPGYQAAVAARINKTLILPMTKDNQSLRPLVTGREDLLALLPRGLLRSEGIFHLHFVLLFVVCILVILATSGIGQSERRREIAILKATGWQTDEILLRGLVESFLLGCTGASLALLVSWVWLKGFNGLGIASVFLPGVEARPDFQVPFRLSPLPLLLTTLFSFVLVMTGTLYSCWRSASAPPLDAMK